MKQDITDVTCSIERGLAVFGDRWTVLILRDAFLGTSRFGEFRRRLGIASDMLAERLDHLVDQGILAREPYQEPGRRVRHSYQLTPKGQDLKVVLGAMQQWGDQYLPRPEGPSMLRRSRQTGAPLAVAFVDDTGRAVAPEDAAFVGRSPGVGRAAGASDAGGEDHGVS
jgi:DNA-binding HxlR family transcriptional regulator